MWTFFFSVGKTDKVFAFCGDWQNYCGVYTLFLRFAFPKAGIR